MSAIEEVAGDAGRIELLYLTHADGAKRLAFLLTGDQALAEDIAQEAFVRAASRLGGMRDPGRFPAYLRKAVVNMTRMHFRRSKTERRFARSVMVPAGSDLGTDVAEVSALHSALSDLSSRQRAAIVLRFWADLSDGEIADSLGCSLGTVRSLVSRGVATLRLRLEGDQ